jgi:hypothetical protein
MNHELSDHEIHDTISELAASAACTLIFDPTLNVRDVAHFAPAGREWDEALAAELKLWNHRAHDRVIELLAQIGSASS